MQTTTQTTLFQQQLVAYAAAPEIGSIQDPSEHASAVELIDIVQRHKGALTAEESNTLDVLYTKWKSRLCKLADEELKRKLLDRLTTPSRRIVQERLFQLASVEKDQVITIDEKRELTIFSPSSLLAKLASWRLIQDAPQQKREPTDAEVGDVFLQYLLDNVRYIDDSVSKSLDALHAYWRQRKVVQVVSRLSELLLKWHPFHKLLASMTIETSKRNYHLPPAILAAINYEETGGRFCKIRRLCTRAWSNLPLKTVVHLRAFPYTLHNEDRADRLAKLVRFLITRERWGEAKLIVSEYNRRCSRLEESLETYFQGKILASWAYDKILTVIQNLGLRPRFFSFQKHWDPLLLAELPSVETLQAWLHHGGDKNKTLCEQIAKMPNLQMLGLGISDVTRTNELFSIESLRNLKITSLTLSNTVIPRMHTDVLASLTCLVYLTVQMPSCKIGNAASVSHIVQHVPCTLRHLYLKDSARELRLCFTYLRRFTELQSISLVPIDEDQARFQKEAQAHYKLKS